jgi:N utilization substance protein B
MKRERRRVRSLALQALYEIDSVHHPPEEVVTRYVDENHQLGEDAIDFFRKMVFGTNNAKSTLDKWISGAAPEWPVDELAVIDRTILRLALWELSASESTPLKVAINEAVELAKRYGSESTARFVNGVLGTLAAQDNFRQQIAHLNLGRT